MHLDAARTAAVLGVDLEAAWPTLAPHWDALEPDRYLADGGRSRRRRHACFEIAGSDVRRLPHRPHLQRREHNHLFGDLPRWFAPMDPSLDHDPTLARVLRVGAALFAPGAVAEAEVHLFRVLAEADRPGEPTPEGIHRDGVDGVCVLLVARCGIVGGCSTITDTEGRVLARPQLRARGEALLLDDTRVRHGTEPIHPLAPDGVGRPEPIAPDGVGRPEPIAPDTVGHRDVLVVTFRARPGAASRPGARSAPRGPGGPDRGLA